MKPTCTVLCSLASLLLTGQYCWHDRFAAQRTVSTPRAGNQLSCVNYLGHIHFIFHQSSVKPSHFQCISVLAEAFPDCYGNICSFCNTDLRHFFQLRMFVDILFFYKQLFVTIMCRVIDVYHVYVAYIKMTAKKEYIKISTSAVYQQYVARQYVLSYFNCKVNKL